MTVATQTLEGQLDALIAEHGLTAIVLTRLVRNDGTTFWSVTAHDDGKCGSNGYPAQPMASGAITAAIENLNEKRTRPVVVPELAAMEQAA